MARYYFHVRDGAEVSRDTEGQDFKDLEAARGEALNSARELVGERLLHGGSISAKQIEIADETGRVVDVVNPREAVLKNGELRNYSDDITKSANKPSSRQT